MLERSESNKLPPKAELQIAHECVAKCSTADELLKLTRISKAFANTVSQHLRNPIQLLQLMQRMQPSELVQMVFHFFAPESHNYQAIAAASKKNPLALLCFALITNDVKSLDWAAVDQAMDDLGKSNASVYAAIRPNLVIMREIANAKTPEDAVAILERERGRSYQSGYAARSLCYLNLSKVNFTGSSIDSMDLSLINFRHANFAKAKFNAIDLGSCILDGTDFKGAKLGPYVDGVRVACTTAFYTASSVTKDSIKKLLDQLAKYKPANPESDKIIRDEILDTLIKFFEANLDYIKIEFLELALDIARMAQAHDYFRKSKATNSQSQLNALIQKLTNLKNGLVQKNVEVEVGTKASSSSPAQRDIEVRNATGTKVNLDSNEGNCRNDIRDHNSDIANLLSYIKEIAEAGATFWLNQTSGMRCSMPVGIEAMLKVLNSEDDDTQKLKNLKQIANKRLSSNIFSMFSSFGRSVFTTALYEFVAAADPAKHSEQSVEREMLSRWKKTIKPAQPNHERIQALMSSKCPML